ncbi:MAG: hypothetical protein ACRENE_34210 [Polyangiaceae bacterium]
MKRSALVCVLVGVLAGCGGTAPALYEVDADDGSSGGSSSDGSVADAHSTDDATIEGGAEGSADSTVDQTAAGQDAVAEASDGGIVAAADATIDVAEDGVPEGGADASADAGPCTTGTVVCGPDGYQVECQSDGGWAPYTASCLCGYLCDADGGVTCGGTFATCAPNARQCSSNAPSSCVPYGPGVCGVWTVFAACVNQACVSGVCTGVCTPGSSQCSGGSATQICGPAGTWGTAIPCEAGTCAGGYCTGPADAGAGD